MSTASTIRPDQRRAAARQASFTRRGGRGFSVVTAAVAATVMLALPTMWPGQAGAASQIFVALEYQVQPATTGCADVSGFREGVQRQLGYDPFRAQADRRVAVRVTRSDAGYEGRIQWTDARGRNVGERRLSTRRQGCTEILNNLAFAVAVQIQLLAAVAPPPPPPAPREPAPSESSTAPVATTLGSPASGSGETAPAAEASPAASVTPPPEPPVAPEPPAAEAIHVIAPPPAPPADTTSKLQLSIGFGPSLALALAPSPTAMGRLFVDGRLSWLSVELSLDGALPVERQEASGAGFSFHRFDAEGALCGHAQVLSACVTAGLAYLQASGSRVDAPRSPSGFGGQAGARVVASQDFGSRYFAALRAEGLVVLSRWTVDLNQLSVWSTPRLAALIGVDVGARIF